MKWFPAYAVLLIAANLAAAQQPGDGGVAPAANPRPFFVVLDPAHGGTDTGARLADHLLEKDLTLSLSIRLRSALTERGMTVVVTRESDVSLAPVERAEAANHKPAAACIVLHATSAGSGVHLFTSSLAPTPQTRFLPWETAQSASAQPSVRLASEVNAALASAEIPVTLGRTSLQPLDSLACPAVAVELAPLAASAGQKAEAISDPGYQAKIIAAIADAIGRWKVQRGQQPQESRPDNKP